MKGKVYIISDTHFRHRNIIEYTTRINYLEPKDIDTMAELIIERWNSVVTNDDIVYHLGDFGFGGAKVFSEMIGRLNGRIRIIRGNHDPRKSQQWYLDVGFDAMYDNPIILDRWFILSHEPISYLPPSFPMVNIHGHTHDECFANVQRYNVSWEITEGVPVLFDDIKEYYSYLNEADDAAKIAYKQRHEKESLDYNDGYMAGFLDAKKTKN